MSSSSKQLRLDLDPVNKRVYMGRKDKDGDEWLEKVDVTDQFVDICFGFFEPYEETTLRDRKGSPVGTVTLRLIQQPLIVRC